MYAGRALKLFTLAWGLKQFLWAPSRDLMYNTFVYTSQYGMMTTGGFFERQYEMTDSWRVCDNPWVVFLQRGCLTSCSPVGICTVDLFLDTVLCTHPVLFCCFRILSPICQGRLAFEPVLQSACHLSQLGTICRLKIAFSAITPVVNEDTE